MAKKIKVEKNCPFCGVSSSVEVDHVSYLQFLNGTNAQNAFPDLHPCDREILINGCCYKCSERIYNSPAPGSDWGERLGECPICGSPIYQRNYKEDEGFYQCNGCCCPLMKDGDEFAEVLIE